MEVLKPTCVKYKSCSTGSRGSGGMVAMRLCTSVCAADVCLARDDNGPNMEDNVEEQGCDDKTIMKTGQCGWQRWGHFVSPLIPWSFLLFSISYHNHHRSLSFR